MNTIYTHILGNKNQLGAKEIGNKAANIEQLHFAGVPVPGGFCLTCEGIVEHLRVGGIKFDIKNILTKITSENNAGYLEAAEIRDAIRTAKVPPIILDELKLIFETMNSKVTSGWIARSSSPVEDSATLAFAGMFDSVGGLFTFQELVDGIKDCWASVFNDRLLSYISGTEIIEFPGIAVLIQPLIPADKAGVIFTSNPVSGRNDRMVLEGTWGLGELLVGGKVTPDGWEIEKGTNTIKNSRVGTKKRMLHLNDNELVETDTPAAQKEILCLSSDEVKQLASIATHVEEFFNTPQDIEWVISDHKIWIVQSRPISNL